MVWTQVAAGNRMDAKTVQKVETSPFDLELQQSDLASKIIIGLERVAEIFRVMLWEKAKRLNLSPIQIQLLIFLRYHGEESSTISSLAREFNLSKPTVSDAVSALGNKGLIDRKGNPIDTRSYSIRLTIKGIKIVRETEKFADPLKQIVAGLSDAEIEKFWSVLSQIIYQSNQASLVSVQRMCFNCKFYGSKARTSYCHLLARKLRPRDIRIDCPEFIDL